MLYSTQKTDLIDHLKGISSKRFNSSKSCNKTALHTPSAPGAALSPSLSPSGSLTLGLTHLLLLQTWNGFSLACHPPKSISTQYSKPSSSTALKYRYELKLLQTIQQYICCTIDLTISYAAIPPMLNHSQVEVPDRKSICPDPPRRKVSMSRPSQTERAYVQTFVRSKGKEIRALQNW